jgi:MinD superfamily P-loop ATPase
VEEPNGFIFLKPSQIKREEVKVDYPVVDSSRCTLCGECAKVCQFNALVRTKKELCSLKNSVMAAMPAG